MSIKIGAYAKKPVHYCRLLQRAGMRYCYFPEREKRGQIDRSEAQRMDEDGESWARLAVDAIRRWAINKRSPEDAARELHERVVEAIRAGGSR